MSRPLRQSGFTLLEILVAVGIFALMFVMAQAALNGALNQRDVLTEHTALQERYQRALIFLAQDFEQAVARPVRDEYGELRPAIRGELEWVEFTRLGWANPFDLRQRSLMQRVGYLLDEQGSLVRRHWPVLDLAVGTEPTEEVLIERVERLRIRYLHDSGGDWQWLERWPDPQIELQPPQEQPLPKAVELELILEDGTRLHRFFRMVVNPWVT